MCKVCDPCTTPTLCQTTTLHFISKTAYYSLDRHTDGGRSHSNGTTDSYSGSILIIKPVRDLIDRHDLSAYASLAEIPGTFIRYFYVGAALRWLMDVLTWPALPEYREMVQAFRDAFQGSRKRTQAIDILSSVADQDSSDTSSRRAHSRPLSEDIYCRLLDLVNATSSSQTTFSSIHEGSIGRNHYLSDSGDFVRTADHDGITYGTSAGSKRNSFVLFSEPNGGGNMVAGQISEIFYHTRRLDADTIIEEPFLLVNRFKPLSQDHVSHDPYLKFLDVPTWLCYNELSSDVILLRLRDIKCHFAALVYTPKEIGQECIAVRSLDRVRFDVPSLLILYLS